jgi:hypothetical protein
MGPYIFTDVIFFFMCLTATLSNGVETVNDAGQTLSHSPQENSEIVSSLRHATTSHVVSILITFNHCTLAHSVNSVYILIREYFYFFS